MYSEDLYATHISDHTVLLTYSALFAVVVIGVLLRMTFNGGNKEYKYTES